MAAWVTISVGIVFSAVHGVSAQTFLLDNISASYVIDGLTWNFQHRVGLWFGGYSCKLIAFSESEGHSLSKIAKIGWLICLIGTALWLHGYFSTGSPADAPWWITDLFPNTEADWGVGLMLCGTALTYWPASPRITKNPD